MAKITPTGIEKTTLAEYKQKFEQDFRAIFGGSISIDPETPQGQIIGIQALTLAQLDQDLTDALNSTDILTAQGLSIDALAANLGITRIPAQKATAQVDLGGINGTTIPAGARARASNGDIYQLTESVTIGVSGLAPGLMEAEQENTPAIGANTLDQIVTSGVSGWLSVNNPAPGIPSKPQETDSNFITRYKQSVSINSVTKKQSILSALLNVPGVEDAAVEDNDQPTPKTVKGLTLPSNSITCVVFGGALQDIVNAIGARKTPGIPTNGTTTGIYENPLFFIQEQEIKFYIAQQIPIEINITIKPLQNFPANGIQDIKNNVFNYFYGNFIQNGVNLEKVQGIAKNILLTRLYTPINAVPFHEVTTLEIGPSGAAVSADFVVNLDQIATLNIDDINVGVA